MAVIGGTSGIGLATAVAAQDAGARVLVTGRDQGRVDEASARLGDAGIVRRCAATDQAAMRAAFTELGSIDDLVLALGSSAGTGPVASLDLDGFRAGFEEKVVAHVAAIQAALPFLAERGSITLISAVSAQAAAPGAVALAAGNGAVEAMVPTLSRELAPIRVNAVSPGVIDTPWWSAVPVEQRQALFAASAERTALGRVGRPEDVADAILALIQSEYVSGAVLPCDGALRYA